MKRFTTYLSFVIRILQYSLNYLKHWSNSRATSNLNDVNMCYMEAKWDIFTKLMNSNHYIEMKTLNKKVSDNNKELLWETTARLFKHVFGGKK